MVLYLVTVLFSDVLLQLFDSLVDELDDIARFETDHVVVMRAVGQLKNRRSPFEIVPADQPSLFELGQDPVDGRQAQFVAVFHQQAINGLRTQMASFCRF